MTPQTGPENPNDPPAPRERILVDTDGLPEDPQAAVFLDRDGVINRRRMTLTRTPEQLEILEGVPAAVARFTEAGYRVVVVTNQSPVAWGLIDPADLDAIHDRVVAAIEQAGGRVDAVYACTHGLREGCRCSKPKPGMLEAAAQRLPIDPERSWMVGDKPSDIKAGRRFGARTAWVTGQRFPWEHLRSAPEADVVSEDLPEAVEAIVTAEP